MEKEHNLKQNFLILFLCLVLLGLINIFYVGLYGRKVEPKSLNGESRPLTSKEIDNLGKDIDPKSVSKPITNKELDNLGKGLDKSNLSTPLTSEEIDKIGR